MRFDFKSATECIWYHSKILCKGFARMVYGAATAGLFAMAAYGFIMIPTEGGYIAVCDFIGSTATTCVAIACMYSLGCRKKKGAKR